MAANDLKNNSFISSYLPSAVFITQRLIGAKEMSETNNSDKHNKGIPNGKGNPVGHLKVWSRTSNRDVNLGATRLHIQCSDNSATQSPSTKMN